MALAQRQVLDALAVPEACLTTAELAVACGCTNKEVGRVVGPLIVKELIERREVGCFRLTAAGVAFREHGGVIRPGPTAPLRQRAARRPRRDTLRDRLWRALRIKGKATIPELLELSLTGQDREAAARLNAQRYLRGLARAGYVRILDRRAPGTAVTSNGCQRYHLIQDTGPETPVLSRGDLWDPNIAARVELAPAEAVTGASRRARR